MSKLQWNEGSPPHVGWWVASACEDESCWRWWSGTRWSQPAYPDFTRGEAAESAKFATRILSQIAAIRWADSWPANARVPRSKP